MNPFYDPFYSQQNEFAVIERILSHPYLALRDSWASQAMWQEPSHEERQGVV